MKEYKKIEVMATQSSGGEGWVCSRPDTSPRLQSRTGGATGARYVTSLAGFQRPTAYLNRHSLHIGAKTALLLAHVSRGV